MKRNHLSSPLQNVQKYVRTAKRYEVNQIIKYAALESQHLKENTSTSYYT
jgi:hypothetical protein